MNEALLRKVKSLLRLGQSPNANEAAVALGKAQALMDEHSISQAMLENQPEQEDAGPIQNWEDPLGKKSGRWQGYLAVSLCRSNGCMVYRIGNVLKIVGRSGNTQTVRYLFLYCTKEINRLTRLHGAGNGRTWCNNFRLGCVEAIRKSIKTEQERLRDSMRKRASQENSNGRALMVVNQAIMKVDTEYKQVAAFAAANLRLGRSGSSYSRFDSGARSAGRTAGAGIYRGNRQAIGVKRKQIGGK